MNKRTIVIRVNTAPLFWTVALVAIWAYLNATFTYLNMSKVKFQPKTVTELRFESAINQEFRNLNKGEFLVAIPDVFPKYRPIKSGRLEREQGNIEKVIASVSSKSKTIEKHFPEEYYVYGAIVLHGEAGAIKSKTEQSGVLWVIWNRVLDERFPDDIPSVVTQEGQFDGYTIDGTYTKADYDLAVDVFERAWREQNGESSESVGRTLPKDYLYFYGDGEHNYFVKEFGGTPYTWGSQFISPYSN